MEGSKNMTQDNNRHELSPDDARLNRLIKAARQLDTTEVVRPDDDAIEAYLLGSPTAEQKQAVVAALIRSPEFRREVLEQAREIKELDVLSTELTPTDGPVPSLEEFPAGYDEESGETKSIPDVGRPAVESAAQRPAEVNPEPTPVTSLHWAWMPVLAVAAVVALVAIVLLQTRSPQATVAQMTFVRDVEKPELITNETLAVRPESQWKVYETSEEAALAGFRSMLRYESGELIPESKEVSESQIGSAPVVQLVDSSGQAVARFVFEQLDRDAMGRSDLQLWGLFLPNYQLLSSPIDRATGSVWLPGQAAGIPLVVLTIREKDGFREIAGRPLE